MSNTIDFKKSKDFGEVFSDSISYMKQHFKLLFKANFLIAMPFVTIGAVGMGMGYGSMFSNIEAMAGSSDNMAYVLEFMIPMLIGLIFIMIGATAVQGESYATLFLVKDSEKEQLEVSDVWKAFKEQLPRLIIGILGLSGIFIVSYLFIILLALIPIIGIIIILGLMIFIIYISVPITYFFPVYLYEREFGFFDALKKSFEIVKGHWWKSFGVHMVSSLVVNMVASLFFIPFYIIMGVSMFHSIDSGGEANFEEFGLVMGIGMSVVMVISYLLITFPLSAVGINYFSLDDAAHGSGILDRLDQMDDSVEMESDQEGEY